MKWSDLTLKERKQIYDAVRAENPNASYFDIKSQFDSIPAYEDGKGRSRWLSDEAYRDSISALQNSQRFKISKEFKSPTLDELRNDSSVGGNIDNSDGLFTVLNGLKALKTPPSITSEQIENATDSQYNSKINRLEPLKQYVKVGSILGQAALGGGAVVARNAGNAALASALQGAGALWDGAEAIQAVNDGDFKSVIQNAVPIGAAGVASLRCVPKFKYTNNLVIDAAENVGPVWDFSVNPLIEATKDKKVPTYEVSHVVDQLAGDVIKNRYLNFLADSDNIMSIPELEKKGIRISPKIQFYLSNPQEAKAHMIQLKHAMLNSGKIDNWSQKVTQQELEDFLFDPLNAQLTGSMNKLQYKMYRNKSRFLDRFNRVNPLAIGAPIGLAATNNKDKQSN